MKTSTSEGKHGIKWTSRMQLDGLDFADDLTFLSRRVGSWMHTPVEFHTRTNRTSNTSKHYQQQPTMGENKPDCSGRRNHEEVMGVDGKHVDESTELVNKAKGEEEDQLTHYADKWRQT
ncbi:unnamed protein product [Schistosoma margrebowiei]|uniref:Uncharacterized protein n=1 Tax=Schistosoma margrebowiei TaxID=48269 RepID=A0A183MI05_9TREM|nr:unnamed protein product [Schistosoma margrebowiei]